MLQSLLLLSLLTTPGLSTLAPSQGCGKARPTLPHPGHHHRYEITVTDPGLGEVIREYAIHLPAHYSVDNNVAVPLLLDYHGWTGNAHDQMVHMPWRDLADQDQPGFIYVAMQGMNDVVAPGVGPPMSLPPEPPCAGALRIQPNVQARP